MNLHELSKKDLINCVELLLEEAATHHHGWVVSIEGEHAGEAPERSAYSEEKHMAIKHLRDAFASDKGANHPMMATLERAISTIEMRGRIAKR